MTVEFRLRSTPIELVPGVAETVRFELFNRSPAPVAVRVALARGRVAGWADVPQGELTVPGGGTATVELMFRAPAEQSPSGSLVPFTVHAVEAATGEPAGFATGLLTVVPPKPVTGELVARDERHGFELRLSNRGETAAAVRIAVELDPRAGDVTAVPDAVHLLPGASATVAVRARPARPILGASRPYFVVATVTDAYDQARPALLSATAAGRRTARVPGWLATTVAIVLALGVTAAVALSGIGQLPGGRSPKAAGTTPGTAPVAPAAVTVSRPYALIEVFPHRGDDGGRAAAEAARDRLAATGMPVKLVDSLSSDVLADGGAGFWVLLLDGFATAEAAQAFCTQWKDAAPKCRVTF
ncbi:MAG TPA: hypothetical protein VFO77_15140 [Actinoplanes sp.]|nr:hypothetical protein [Actinoplanes sp.]